MLLKSSAKLLVKWSVERLSIVIKQIGAKVKISWRNRPLILPAVPIVD